MGTFSLGLFVISVGSWLWFWAVTGLAVAKARGANRALGVSVCVLLGPVGVAILMLASLPATALGAGSQGPDGGGPRPF